LKLIDNVQLTISIVSYNTKALLNNCLDSIYKNIKNISFEVIVVDNNSTDGTIEMLEEKFPRIKLIKNKENVGFAKANNQAILKSRGKYFLLLNSDTVVLPGSIEKMMEFMDSNLEAGAVSCRLIFPDGSPQPWINVYSNMGTNLWIILLRVFQVKRLISKPGWRRFLIKYFKRILGKAINSYFDCYRNGQVIREVDFGSGACLLVRREVIEKVGLLDENFFMYYEDADWCIRIKRAGWKIYFLSNVKIIHYEGKSSNDLIWRISPPRYKSACYFFKKYYGRKSVVLLKVLVIGSLTMQIGLWIFWRLLSNNREEMKRELISYGEIIKISFIQRSFACKL